RLLLKKEVAQKFVIPFLLGGGGAAEEAAQSKHGIQLKVRDADTDTLHSLVFKI
ncbi:B3 domain-containing protein, partial [Trifolium medium]|nr:B3 domain-containing protein [Trifolium medium]